jgi:transposase InsO family protein
VKWCGDITEIPTDEGKLYFASVLDLHSRRLLASATSDHPDAALACDAVKMAAAVRGGRAAIDGVIFHIDRDLPTPQPVSRRCAERSGCRSQWEGRSMFR